MKRKVNRDEVGKVNNPESSLVSAGFQTANGKTISISEESKRSVQNILGEFQDNLQEMNYETELKDIKARMSIKNIKFSDLHIFGKYLILMLYLITQMNNRTPPWDCFLKPYFLYRLSPQTFLNVNVECSTPELKVSAVVLSQK
ncbi:hypothetical protein GQX74_009651 [Glossina fuscipes]|nr:hypothetical protein GQX74_009651 [Glossina fuscipes]